MKKLLFALSIISLFSCETKEDESYWSQSDFCAGCITNGETYSTTYENPFVSVDWQPISTFGLDPDGGSYANAKRLIESGEIPNSNIIRIEEFINYFTFDYSKPSNGEIVYVEGELASCPWTESNKLLRVGIQGYSFNEDYPPSNFVFLIDNSGSMSNEMDLVKSGLNTLINQLKKHDRVSIVTYASNGEVICNGVSGEEKRLLKNYVNQLSPKGSTNGGEGIKDAYRVAGQNYKAAGNNRVLLVTDGDFNLGVSNQEELTELVKNEAKTGVFLSAIGVGSGNYNEANLENLAKQGDGTYDYLGSYYDANKVFIEDFNKFFAVAKDVKIQVEFNPEVVRKYRLIGYENRVMDNIEFSNDSTDSGDLNSDQSVTALYELEMVDSTHNNLKAVDLRFKYKRIEENESNTLNVEVKNNSVDFINASENFRFAAGISGFGLEMKNSQYKGNLTMEEVSEIIENSKSFDPGGHRTSLIQLIEIYRSLKGLE